MAEYPKSGTTHTLFGFGDGFDWRRTSFLEPLPPEMVCSYCGLVCKWTAQLPCLHTACTRCYRKFERRGDTCVLDGRCFTERQVSWAALSEERLAQLSIRCWNVTSGCGVTGPAFYILNHFLRDCEYHVIKCSFCSKTALLRDLDQHLASSCLQAFRMNDALTHEAETDSTSTSSVVSDSVEENVPSTGPSSHDSDSSLNMRDRRPSINVLNERLRKEHIVPVFYKSNEASSRKARDSVVVVAVSVEDGADHSRRTGEVPREGQFEAREPCTRANSSCINGSDDDAEELERRVSSDSTSEAENLGVVPVCLTEDPLYASGEALGHYLRLLWESISTTKERHCHRVCEAQRTPSQCGTSPRIESVDVINTLTVLTNGTASIQIQPTSPGDHPENTGEEKRGVSKVGETSVLSEGADSIESTVDCNSSVLPLSVLLHRDWLHENHLITAETLKEFFDGISKEGPSQGTPKLERSMKLLPKTQECINGSTEEGNDVEEVSRGTTNNKTAVVNGHSGSAPDELVNGKATILASVTPSRLQAALRFSKPLLWSIEDWSGLEAIARDEGEACARCYNDTYLFYGYDITPALHIKKLAGSLYVRLAFFVIRGAFDDLLPWPIQKVMELTFMPPSDKSSRLKLTLNTTANGRSEDYMAPQNNETGPILSMESITVEELKTKGLIVDNKVVLKFEVMEVPSSS
ncbi:uncharacterized protein LOC119372399 [Rhipicephalus sanguineus]|uniref:uncharacterized protein LOC119372399 n=1 Tax=Rhipicephalus sanguineus TaxID=34632 RepID=UPI001895746B|nr:uncharacterized protein LOC119372399 [Rhipicephalus sanguineus]